MVLHITLFIQSTEALFKDALMKKIVITNSMEQKASQSAKNGQTISNRSMNGRYLPVGKKD